MVRSRIPVTHVRLGASLAGNDPRDASSTLRSLTTVSGEAGRDAGVVLVGSAASRAAGLAMLDVLIEPLLSANQELPGSLRLR